MNSSTLRRLASDHSSLHNSGLPPNYLFSTANDSSSSPDDLTHLTVHLTGPQGTPYSQGLWKLHLKIPEDYPKSPPKAAFRTRIWHPNVEETTGSVCVDTLKRDWDSKLTLRDVLVTISCLLIQPNPDSALNSTAGHLLQDDYEAFARQAKLMTSIHARIPSHLKDAVLEAKRRGEATGTVIRDELDERPPMKLKPSSYSRVVMKKAQNIASLSPESSADQPVGCEETSDEDVEDDALASKENDPSQSPSPVMVQSPRKPALIKRPLSDLPTPTEPDSDEEFAPRLSPSERNIANNIPYSSSPLATSIDGPRRNLRLVERSRSVNFTSRGLQDAGKDGLGIIHFVIKVDEAEAPPAQKRLCLWDGKENSTEVHKTDKFTASATRPSLWSGGASSSAAARPSTGATAKQVASSTVANKNVRPRMGLRRL